MRLVLVAIDPESYRNEFTCDLPSLEAGLDFLSKIVKEKHTLLKVELLDEHQRISLPIAAFDGVPFSPVLQALKKDWQAILSRSFRENLLYEDQVWLAKHSIQQCERMIAYHQRMFHWTTTLLQQKQPGKTDQLAGFHKRQLSYHQGRLIQIQTQLELRKDWLERLL